MYIVIAGAGLVGSKVAAILAQHKHDVVVIDLDRKACEDVYAQTGAMTIVGSATDYKDLEEAGIRKADLLFTCMRKDADNISCALLSKSMGVPRVVSRVRHSTYNEAYRLAGVNSLIQMIDSLIDETIYQIESPAVQKLTSFGSGKAEMYVITIEESNRICGMTMKDIGSNPKFPRECIFSGIYRENEDKFIATRSTVKIKANDKLFLVSSHEYIQKALTFILK